MMPGWSAAQQLAEVKAEAVALDRRRQKQIDNQIGSINRLLAGGHTYTDEMSHLQALLAGRDASLEEIYEELRGLADSLDDSVIAKESERLPVYDSLVTLMRRVKEAQSAS